MRWRDGLIIDSHVHPYFADWFPGSPRGAELALPEDWLTIYSRLHRAQISVPTFEEFLRELRDAAIDRVVVFDRDIETRNGKPPNNDWVLDLARAYPEVFIPFYALDPNKGLAAVPGLMAAVMRGARGVKIHPYGADVRPNDRRLYPLYAAIQDLGVPIIFHTGPGPLGTRSELSSASHFDDLCVDFPDLKIIMAHFGGDDYMTAHMLAWRYPNLYVDIAFLPEVYLSIMPWRLFEETIPDKILLGSDFPLERPAERLRTLQRLNLSESTIAKIGGENVKQVLNL